MLDGKAMLRVVWYEIMFDIKHEAHLHLGHPKNLHTVKNHLDLQVYGIPKNAVKL